MRTFNFPLGILVSAGQLGWLNCKNQQEEFQLMRAVYTLLYIQGKIDLLTALSEMPDEFERAVLHETLRVNLINQAKKSLKLWRRLRRYCVNAYPKDQRDLMLKEMGREYLTESLNDNWTATQMMLTKGSTFITKHEAELLASDNMPATFKDLYNNEGKKKFIDCKNAFYQSEEEAKTLTATIDAAANSVYEDLMLMLDDGKSVFEGNETMRDLFTLDYLLGIVRPTGPAGLKGTVELGGEPAVGIIVELENKNLSVIVDAEGAFNFGEKLASGKDKLIFKRGDQILKEEEVDIPPGTTVTEHVELPAGV